GTNTPTVPVPTSTRTATPASPTPTVCVATNYVITSSTGATIVPATTDTGNHCDDCGTSITLPFPITLYDQSYTTAMVGSNGMIAFGTAYTGFGVTCAPQAAATYSIGPYWVDQWTATPCADCGIFTLTTGTAPNRIFYVEYKTVYYPQNAQTVHTLDYELIFTEGSTTVKVAYGLVTTVTGNDSALTVEVQKSTTQYTQYGTCDSTGGTTPPVSSGQRLTFTLPPCVTSTPATSTPTAPIGASPTCTASNFHILIV